MAKTQHPPFSKSEKRYKIIEVVETFEIEKVTVFVIPLKVKT